MRDSHLLRALKEGGHKWNPGVKCDSRSAALEGDIFLASRAAREDQDDFAVLQLSTAVLIELGDGSARLIGREPPCVKTKRDSVESNSSSFDI
jgi:hypothetical protein